MPEDLLQQGLSPEEELVVFHRDKATYDAHNDVILSEAKVDSDLSAGGHRAMNPSGRTGLTPRPF